MVTYEVSFWTGVVFKNPPLNKWFLKWFPDLGCFSLKISFNTVNSEVLTLQSLLVFSNCLSWPGVRLLKYFIKIALECCSTKKADVWCSMTGQQHEFVISCGPALKFKSTALLFQGTCYLMEMLEPEPRWAPLLSLFLVIFGIHKSDLNLRFAPQVGVVFLSNVACDRLVQK